MVPSSKLRPLAILSVAVAAAMLACSLGAPASPTPASEGPAQTDATPSATPTEAGPPPDPLVVTFQEPVFNLYRLDGTLVETRASEGLNWPRPNTAQVVGQDIYYVRTAGPDAGDVVRRVTASGAEDLAFTAAENMGSLSFAVSDDGSKIAWARTSGEGWPPVSRLWLASIDGSGTTLVAESDPNDDITEWFVLEPVTWLSDGDLVYAWQITGIGGYILFYGWSSLYRYDVDGGTTAALAPLLGESQGPCWSDVTSDGAYAISSCGGPGQMVERATASGVETLFPVLPEQGQAGAGSYSASGERLAYGIARSDPEDEAGQVILISARGEAPASIASHAPGYFSRLLWIDEARMVAGYWQVDGGLVDLLDVDGTRSRIGDGHLIGLMQAGPGG
jgi:hypothetical protein